MRLQRVDLFFLHTNIRLDGFVYAHGADRAGAGCRRPGRSTPRRWSRRWRRLKADGRIGAWGITGIGVPDAVLAALAHDPKPQPWCRPSPT